MVKARWVRLVAGLFVLSLVVAACGGDDDGGDTTGATVSGPTEVTITNDDDATHTFTLDDDSVDETIDAGATATVTVDVSQTTGFHCTIHPDMTGTVEVA